MRKGLQESKWSQVSILVRLNCVYANLTPGITRRTVIKPNSYTKTVMVHSQLSIQKPPFRIQAMKAWKERSHTNVISAARDIRI